MEATANQKQIANSLINIFLINHEFDAVREEYTSNGNYGKCFKVYLRLNQPAYISSTEKQDIEILISVKRNLTFDIYATQDKIKYTKIHNYNLLALCKTTPKTCGSF